MLVYKYSMALSVTVKMSTWGNTVILKVMLYLFYYTEKRNQTIIQIPTLKIRINKKIMLKFIISDMAG